jgi:hypothetical protein
VPPALADGSPAQHVALPKPLTYRHIVSGSLWQRAQSSQSCSPLFFLWLVV